VEGFGGREGWKRRFEHCQQGCVLLTR